MEPIGLKFKNPKQNPYTGKVSGELMIVHRCLGCGVFSTNRIAGDDNCFQILNLLQRAAKPDIDKRAKSLYGLLTTRNKEEVATMLFGHNYKNFLNA